MTSFEELGLSKKVLSAVDRMGYEQPTPVQEKAIPLVLKGRDIIAAAQTGTGKTAAFSLPALDKLGHAKGGSGPLMLVVTPTRELAQQIGEVCRQIAVSTHHRIVTVVGGLSYKPQIERLSHGCDVLIATPGRLIDLMDQNAVRLADVQVLVLDEADRMLDMGFLPSVKKIVAATPKSRQTLLFSATIDRTIQDITGKMLRDPATVEIARRGDVAETVEHYIIRVPQSVKPKLLKAVLEEKGFFRVIIFARTRSRADASMRRLRKAGYEVETIHSNRSQNQRKRSLDKFAKGEVNIITATDVLARGIDVAEVDYVINYDVPDQPEDYIHRIGRTGRAGAKGLAITFVTPETEGALRDIERLIKQKIPEMELRDFDMAAATAESAEASITAQSRRDPEVNRVRRDLLNRERKAAEERQSGEANRRRRAGATSAKGAKGAASGRVKGDVQAGSGTGARGTAKKTSNKNGSRSRTQTARNQSTKQQRKAAVTPKAARAGKPVKQSKQGRSSAPSKKGDFRPGRSRRAELQRSRKRSR